MSDQRANLVTTSAVSLTSLMGRDDVTELADEVEKVEQKRKTLLTKVRRIREKRARVFVDGATAVAFKPFSLEADAGKSTRLWIFSSELLQETSSSNKHPYVDVVYTKQMETVLSARLEWMQTRGTRAKTEANFRWR